MTNHTQGTSSPPLSAILALLTCFCGFMYCLNFSSFFERLHWYSFATDVNLSMDDFDTFLVFTSIVLFVYYSMFLVLSCMLFLRIQRRLNIIFFIMAVIKIIIIAMMFVPGNNMVFQFGFEALMEALALLCIIYIRRNSQGGEGMIINRLTIGIIGILAECIPLIRNMQFLFFDDMNPFVRISIIALPCLTAAFIFVYSFNSYKKPLIPEAA